ncbi:MAG: hypothetical protein FWD59_09240 [Micrococcales bacterium]|nr:hypothetical protein [Micrococcales bacterium]
MTGSLQTSPAGPEVPTPFDRRAEVEALLDDDDTVLGLAWRYDKEGLTPQQMMEAEGTATTGWVSNNRTLIRVLRDGEIPTSPSVAQNAGRRVRSWLKSKPLSAELRTALTEQESLIMSRAEDRTAQTEEVQDAVVATASAEADQVPGIYVYTLPHYLRYPYDPVSGRTLLKVGHSAVDAHYRAESQGRLTALPEDPILLRIYPAEASAHAERTFHSWLRDADHASSRTIRGGAEWFLTSTKFLDRIARSLGLETRVVNDFEAGDD